MNGQTNASHVARRGARAPRVACRSPVARARLICDHGTRGRSRPGESGEIHGEARGSRAPQRGRPGRVGPPATGRACRLAARRQPRRGASRRRRRGRPTGSAGARISPSGSGARCARTTPRRGTAWEYFPHDHARSRAYRWGEDGLLGISDNHQRLCFALALWNDTRPDPEGAAVRPHGPRGQPRRGRQGVLLLPRRHADPLLHAGPLQVSAGASSRTCAWSRRTRGADGSEPEFELLDTGVFDDDRYFDVLVEYAKASPNDVLIRVTVDNRGPEPAPLHLLPTLWFRNTWTWEPEARKPRLVQTEAPAGARAVRLEHPELSPDFRFYARRRAPLALHRQRDERPPPVRRRPARRRPEGRVPRGDRPRPGRARAGG